MPPRRHKQLLLLLGAVVLPSVLLLALAVRAHQQEQALATQALHDARKQAARQLGQQLSITLAGLRLAQVTALANGTDAVADPAVVLAGEFAGGNLRPAPGVRSRFSPGVAAALRDAESAEFGGRIADATRGYRQTLSLARDTASMAQARLGLARTLSRSGWTDSAVVHYQWVLALPFGVRDDEDLPYALYGADRLKQFPQQRSAVAARLAERLSHSGPLPRLESYMLRDLADSLSGSPGPDTLREAAAAHVRLAEQLAALQRDLPTLLRLRSGRLQPSDNVVWIPYGEPLWLVSADLAPGRSDTFVVVVSAEKLASVLTAESSPYIRGAVRLAAQGSTGDGEPLGPEMSGLVAVLAADAIPPQRRSTLLGPLLLLVVALTALSAYLLSRDVQREMRAAAVRYRFVSAVSHELKTPLTSIRMFAEMLRMRPHDICARTSFLDTIIGESERLTRLIENVLHFSRLEERRQSYRLAPTKIEDVVREAAQAMSYPIAQQGLELRVDVDLTLPPVRLDRDALVQAILNLLSNAVKFSPNGGEIALRLERANGEALIHVRDQGIGIDRKEHVRVFDEFYRSPAAEASGIEGTGLGLALVADVARAHGGKVELDSQPGAGSTFTLRIPMAAAE